MPDVSPFLRLLQAIGRDDDVVRIARGDQREFTTFPVKATETALEPALQVIEDLSQNAWFEVQSSSFDEPKGRSSEKHISNLRAVYADIDFKGGDASRPGMGSEPAALDLVDQLTSALGVPPVAIVYSGHGIQPYWPVEDGGIDEGNASDIKALLKRFGILVQTFAIASGGHVDNVFDLPRILRIPGPDNVKDPANPEPTRVVFPEGNLPLGVAELAEILDDYEVEAPKDVELNLGAESPAADWDWAEHDCQFVERAMFEISESLPTARHQWGLKWMAILHGMIRYGCLTEESYLRLRDGLASRWAWAAENLQPVRPLGQREVADALTYGLGQAQVWTVTKLSAEMRHHEHQDFAASFPAVEQTFPAPIAADAAGGEITNVTSLATRQPLTQAHSGLLASAGQTPVATGNVALKLEPKSAERLQHSLYTDTGNAEQLALRVSGRFIFVEGNGWYVWDESRYRPDTSERIVEEAKDLFGQMAKSGDESISTWGRKSLSSGKIAASVKLAETVEFVRKSAADLDDDPYVIVTPDGIVSLRDGSIRPADPRTDFNSHQTNATPDFTAGTPHWLGFLEWALKRQDLIDYLQELAGLALIGELRHHVFPIWLGNGGNGKSVIASIWAHLMGSYAINANRKFLVDTGSDPHPEAIAKLMGKRFVVVSEVPAGAKFAEDLVKQLTGESTLTGRYMHENSFDFPNQLLTLMLANHLPTVPGGGYSMFRRIRKIDFESTVEDGKENPMLIGQMIAAEGPGILAWMVRGAARVLQTGKINEPASVKLATKGYQMEEDYIGRFLSETLEPAEGVSIDRAHVYGLYREWTVRNGLNPMNAIRFAREVTILHPTANRLGGKVFADLHPIPPVFKHAEEDGRNDL